MPEARTVPATKIFWLLHRFPRGTEPRLREPAETREYEPPYRVGRGTVWRIPFTLRGIALGRWEREEDEDVAVWAAVGGYEMDASTEDVKGWAASTKYADWEERERVLSQVELGPSIQDLLEDAIEVM